VIVYTSLLQVTPRNAVYSGGDPELPLK